MKMEMERLGDINKEESIRGGGGGVLVARGFFFTSCVIYFRSL